jgi:hypothetical protein
MAFRIFIRFLPSVVLILFICIETSSGHDRYLVIEGKKDK